MWNFYQVTDIIFLFTEDSEYDPTLCFVASNSLISIKCAVCVYCCQVNHVGEVRSTQQAPTVVVSERAAPNLRAENSGSHIERHKEADACLISRSCLSKSSDLWAGTPSAHPQTVQKNMYTNINF